MTSPIFLILGTPASGKSTVARALMRRFERGVHLPVDDVRHQVVSGLVDFSEHVDDEAWRQLRIARAAVTATARIYARAGFAAAIDDFWSSETPDAEYQFTSDDPVHRVVLFPSLEATLERLYQRNPAEGSFKKAIEGGIHFIRPMIEQHAKTGWLVVDSSHLSPEATVDFILAGVQR